MNTADSFAKHGLKKKLKVKSKLKPIDRNTQFNVLRAVMPVEKAKELAGYSSGTKVDAIIAHGDAVSAIRERLQNVAGVTLEDQVNWYASIRNDAESASVGERISAAKQIDTVLGYNAPQKVDISERRELSAAISVVSNLGINPMDLKRMVDARKNTLNVSTQDGNL